MQTQEIRTRFIEHFVKAGHTSVPSASLILDDPNLLFVNAGMVPFKPYFLGQETPPFSRATSIQKCVRTLDIDEVGVTTRHNTFFQMAGNFSFGDYFKEGAITLAWSLLTGALSDGGFAIPVEKLWVTVYHDDDEAATIWRDIVGVNPEHIQRRGMEDNYWSMGVPGPCGPCSEIFYDRGPEYGVDGGPIADEDRYIEIWNLVFMQNERGEGVGKDGFDILGPLPKKNIDTGLGVERVAFLLQGVENVYETDLLRPVIGVTEELTGSVYEDKDARGKRNSVYFRIIADHSRTAAMLISDGVNPGNEGRGYILRRLLRRIVRSARLLGSTEPIMAQLMEVVRDTMSPSYPELSTGFERILRVATGEEIAFLRTLESGNRLLQTAVDEAKNEGKTELSGERAFVLHDTHGFPIDLTVEMAAELGLSVDQTGFQLLMEEQRDRAKADSRAKKHAHADLGVYRDFIDRYPTVFTGYEFLNSDAVIVGIIQEKEVLAKTHLGDGVSLLLDRTPFYAEGGGQLGDRGLILGSNGAEFVVDDVQRVGKKLFVHRGHVSVGQFQTKDAVKAQVDPTWRHQARQAHSATHLVHAELQNILGPNAIQAGSLNKPGYLRFDFSWGAAITDKQLKEIGDNVNAAIDADLPVRTVITDVEEAKSMGALALFGESYGERVRVVLIGENYSIELCGGTHVSHTSKIGPVAIFSEASIGSGTRRIEAYVGQRAYEFLSQGQAHISTLTSALRVSDDQLVDRVEALQVRIHDLEKERDTAQQSLALSSAPTLFASAETIGKVKVVAASVATISNGGDLRQLALDIRHRFGTEPAVVALFGHSTGKVPFVIALNDQAQELELSAGGLVSLVAPSIGGRGGGKKDLAQGAGTRPDGVDNALNQTIAEVSKIVS